MDAPFLARLCGHTGPPWSSSGSGWARSCSGSQMPSICSLTGYRRLDGSWATGRDFAIVRAILSFEGGVRRDLRPHDSHGQQGADERDGRQRGPPLVDLLARLLLLGPPHSTGCEVAELDMPQLMSEGGLELLGRQGL